MNIFTTKSTLCLFTTSMSDMSRSNEYWVDHIWSSDLMKFFQLLLVSIMIELQVKRYAAVPTSMACDALACCQNCCCIWARLVSLVLVLCQTTNNPVGCSTCLASLAQPSSIRSGVEFSFNDYNLSSFCKHPRSMQHFFSDSSRAFLSSLFLSACIFN